MNRIYKTVWNRLRRMYVAVNESKRSHSFAKKAAVVATASIAFIANAQTINSSGSISGNYSDLTAEDIRGTIAVEGVIDTDSVAGWEGSLGTHYYTYYWEDPPSWVIETAREYGINELRDEYSWNMDGYVKPIEVSESDLPDINNIRLKVERDRSLVVSGTLNLGTVSQTSQVTVRYIRFVNNGCYDVGGGGTPGCSYTISERTTTRNIDQTGNTELINDGGSITVNNLVFETSENRFIQNSGTSEIERYSGGGLIDDRFFACGEQYGARQIGKGKQIGRTDYRRAGVHADDRGRGCVGRVGARRVGRIRTNGDFSSYVRRKKRFSGK